MEYQAALAYIYSFTDYERGSKYSRNRNENLAREAALLEVLGNPHRAYSNTLVAGTKGKGSTSAIIERVLREAGVQTGLYTQPDLHTFRERIRMNGELIPMDWVGQLMPEVRAAVEWVQQHCQFEPFITYEIGTTLAFLYFARRHVQHAVVEVGIGGRLDATNVTQPLVSVISSISYDHMDVLGETLAKIATEKAGIIKPNGLVVTSAQSPEALLAIADVARQRRARMIRVGPEGPDLAQSEVDVGSLPVKSYRYEVGAYDQGLQGLTVHTPTGSYQDLQIPLLGVHQIENATLAIATLEVLREAGYYWDEGTLRRGLRAVRWPGRLEVVGQEPTIVVDGAHNTDSMQKLLAALRAYFPVRQLIVVLGVLKNKDLAGMVRTLAGVDAVVLTRVGNPRAVEPTVLAELFAQCAPNVQVYQAGRSSEALDIALELAGREDLVCATGSLYLVGEALRWAAVHGDALAASEIEGVDHP